MPQCLLDFVTHVVGYKALLSKWAEGDYSERRSTIGWPPEFDIYVERSYQALKAEQTRLLHNALVAAMAPRERTQEPLGRATYWGSFCFPVRESESNLQDLPAFIGRPSQR